MNPLVRDYLLLGLRLGRLVDGLVDCYYGDPALRDQVAAEPPPDPRELSRQAGRTLAALDDSDLEPARRRYLTAQLAALRAVADRLAGTPMSFRDEVRACYDVDVTRTPPERYAAVHDEIDALLPGPGPLVDRVEEFYRRNTVPPERLHRCVQAVSDALRERTRDRFGLPGTERVEYTVVRDAPWNAYNSYLGGFRSAVALNAASGRSVAALPIIVAHESYPGHHTEHCLKEAGLVRDGGQDEHTIALVDTPRCLVTEGLAEAAVDAVLGPGWGEWTAGILAGEGVHVEGERVERMRGLIVRLLPARIDAALLLHDEGGDRAEALAYLRRWMLLPPDRAEQMVTFAADPLWRAYSVTYSEGGRLVDAWLAAREPGTSLADRFDTLLREPLLPSQLRADVAGTAETTKGVCR